MTLVSQITSMLDPADSAEPRWRAHTLQVVNWGGFHGPARVQFAPDVTVISGQSGAGKSTLLDAYIALMMPPNVPFNGASNDSGGGRARSAEQRNLLSYLRGKLDDTLDDGEVVDRVMRGNDEPTWGAVAMTFISAAGEMFTAMRAYFAPARAARPGDLVIRPMTFPGEFDLRELQQFAQVGEAHFPSRQMKAQWPGLQQYETYSSFIQTLYVRLGIGLGGDGAKALRLLARIQASEDISTVDRLYKELVIETPDSYAKADAAIEHFDKLEDVYQEMLTAQARAELLEPVIQAHAELVAAQEQIDNDDELGSIDSNATPAGLWRLRLQSQVLERAVTANRNDARALREELLRHTENENAVGRQLEETRKAHSEAGGDLLVQLDTQIREATSSIRIREERRATLVKATTALGADLTTHESFGHAQQESRALLDDFAAAEMRVKNQRDDLIVGRGPLIQRRDEITRELGSFENRSGRVDEYLHEMREQAARASGIDVADLPFVAELLDVLPDEEQWRTSIEVSLFSGARLMLVPYEHFEHFSRAINPLKLHGRLNFKAVRRTTQQKQLILEPDRIAGKLQFKESPYQSWVTDYVADPSRNALCVENPEQLGGDDLRITREGQSRRGSSGSHGRQSRRNVIGFDNADLRAELERDLEQLQSQIETINADADRLDRERTTLASKKEAASRIADQVWTDIDVASAVEAKSALERRRDEIRDNNDVLAELDRQITELAEQHESLKREGYLRSQQISELDKAHSKFVDQEDQVNPVIAQLDADGVTIRDELASDLDRMWAAMLGDEPDVPASFARTLNVVRRELGARAEHAREQVSRLRTQIEGAFKRYQSSWNDANLGVSIDFFDDYAAIYEQIVRSGLRERREEWRNRVLAWSGEHLQQLFGSLNSAIEEIEDRLDPINQILRDLPFGATEDRLYIDMRRLKPEHVTNFRTDLRRHASMATAHLDEEELEKRFKDLQRFIAQIRRKDDVRLPREMAVLVDRDRLLDVRRHVEISAQRLGEDGKPLSIYKSLQGKSGGEMQELIAFIVGSALRFQLGDQKRSHPRFAPVFLDEGFIKADGQFTSRAVQAWQGLGFQLIIGAPIDKAPALEPHADVVVEIAKVLSTGRSYVLEMRATDAARGGGA
ncbi:ATP-binding protein [Microbacterium sp. 22195]|uniref:ATP-binding protein n=1 Tax=Microbacterium sp. 22195 TaxID=3453891 RepID=UPI003F844CB2